MGDCVACPVWNYGRCCYGISREIWAVRLVPAFLLLSSSLARMGKTVISAAGNIFRPVFDCARARPRGCLRKQRKNRIDSRVRAKCVRVPTSLVSGRPCRQGSTVDETMGFHPPDFGQAGGRRSHYFVLTKARYRRVESSGVHALYTQSVNGMTTIIIADHVNPQELSCAL